MSMLDGLMGQMQGQAAAMIAQRLGIDPAVAQNAIAALINAHPQPTDTVATAAQTTGLSPDLLNQIVGHLGGENALGSLMGALGGPQPAATGGTAPADGLGGMLGGLMGGLMGGTKN